MFCCRWWHKAVTQIYSTVLSDLSVFFSNLPAFVWEQSWYTVIASFPQPAYFVNPAKIIGNQCVQINKPWLYFYFSVTYIEMIWTMHYVLLQLSTPAMTWYLSGRDIMGTRHQSRPLLESGGRRWQGHHVSEDRLQTLASFICGRHLTISILFVLSRLPTYTNWCSICCGEVTQSLRN